MGCRRPHLFDVTVSIRVMTAGQGVRYLFSSIIAGDGDRDATTALTRYYVEQGTPPGRWMGRGLTGLTVTSSSPVTEEQLRRLLGHGQDPMTGEPLGRPYRTFAPATDRVARRLAALPGDLTGADHTRQVAWINAEEAAKAIRVPVAGFDLTFSAPKSLSSLWAVADGGTQALIAQAHHAAIDDVLDLMEREVAMTRVGAEGMRGAVAQVQVRGVVAAAFDHYDSRAADPQLHTHVVVANRVQAVRDGRWRTLDSRALHGAVAGLSEHYNAVLSDHVARLLGVGWQARTRGPGRITRWEITGVPQELMDEFSVRTHDLEQAKDRLVSDYVARHGRAPSRAVLWRIRQQATLATRPPKETHSLAELTDTWRRRATTLLGRDATGWASQVLGAGTQEALLRADDLPLEHLHQIAATVLQEVGDRRSTWRRWNLHAEAVRQTMRLRFGSAGDREAVLRIIVEAAEHASLQLTPPELAVSPQQFRRADGSSVLRPRASIVYSSGQMLAAEDRLRAATLHRTAPTVSADLVQDAARPWGRLGGGLAGDQVDAITAIGVSARVLDLLVGPAGTGKTRTMAALRRAWEQRYGPGSVLGLAPSAAAAAVLGDELGIPTENTTKWLYEHRRGNWRLTPGQLVIIDEASLAGTFALDAITTHAATVGAKVLLVGDWAQLQAVDAGGAFGMLVRERPDAPQLVDVRRFGHDWEKHASLGLRLGDTAVIDTYLTHSRVLGADYDTVLDSAYQAWRADQRAGKVSVLIAEANQTVIELNQRARADRVLAGLVDEAGVRLHDGTQAARGDLVVTRKNDRRLALGRGWVKNNDRWQVVTAHTDGSLTVRREASRWHTTLRLPADYVANDVELGYAITAYRAQGVTVDSAHTLVASTTMTREAFYVAMSRGRQSNIAYVATDAHDLEDHQRRDDLAMTASSILFGILQHSGAELSATETLVAEQDAWGSIRQLVGEYDTIAQVAQHERWLALLRAGGLDEPTVDELVTTDSYPILAAALRRLEADGHDVERLLPQVVRAGGLAGAQDLGSLLRYRLQRATSRYTPAPRRRRLIAGLIPQATGVADPQLRVALAQREQLITQRADALAAAAAANPQSWATHLGPVPADPTAAARCRRQLATVAAYRDRWTITTSDPLGPIPGTDAQRLDYERARAALRTLQPPALDEAAGPWPAPTRTTARPPL